MFRGQLLGQLVVLDHHYRKTSTAEAKIASKSTFIGHDQLVWGISRGWPSYAGSRHGETDLVRPCMLPTRGSGGDKGTMYIRYREALLILTTPPSHRARTFLKPLMRGAVLWLCAQFLLQLVQMLELESSMAT